MSKIEVNAIEPQCGTTLTIGASGDTVTIPSGATLANNGTATGFASIDWQSSIVTAATLTAVAGRGYWIDTSSNACTITLPAAASVGDQIIFTDYARNWATNAVTLNPNSLKFQGSTSPNPIYNTNGQSVDIVYSGATKGWIPNSDDDVTLETPQTYSADFLVIAGGGSGGGLAGGGGGAGGYRTSTQTLNFSTVYTITVGDGGAARASGGPANGNTGSNSSISGSGLTTITSAGGGYGTAYNGSAGGDGGSGGGGGGGAGTIPGGDGNTPSTSPSQGNNGGSGVYISPPGGGRTAGGGGGASAVGGNGDGANPGTSGSGGNGSASSITGSSVTRAGGGGGSMNGSGATYGTGGTGGGGDGVGAGNGNPGTANTGSGGSGSSEDNTSSGAGGKGVVILSVPTSNYSGTTTGSPTVTTSGSNTIIQFNGSGSYTA